MARMVEKTLLAGAIGLTSALGGCTTEQATNTAPQATNTTTQITPSSRRSADVMTIQPETKKHIQGGVICAGHRVRLYENNGNSVTFDAEDRNRNILPNSAAEVTFPPEFDVTVGSGDDQPIYCEVTPGHPNAQSDVEQELPKGTVIVRYVLNAGG